ncbi:MAG: carboxypeptidase regulatory-like domain-containing protein [Acidobacteria bacterium]|nr:carboxypeptidase regulatory-like domain-containing protein [Acidobacteriota bacterium]
MIRCAALLLCAGLTALGQTTRGRIVGIVSDTSGAIVPSASVVARNAGTSARLTAVTSASGTFAFADLPIGRYEISVEVPGFKKYLQGPFDLLVDQTVRIDVARPDTSLTL